MLCRKYGGRKILSGPQNTLSAVSPLDIRLASMCVQTTLGGVSRQSDRQLRPGRGLPSLQLPAQATLSKRYLEGQKEHFINGVYYSNARSFLFISAYLVRASVCWMLKLISCWSICRLTFSTSRRAFCSSFKISAWKKVTNNVVESIKVKSIRWRRGTSPKYKNSHFPEKANTGLRQEEVIWPTFLENVIGHFPPKKIAVSHLPEI